MAVKGSTAPAITSPLLAWPAKPTPRTPLATPSNPYPNSTFESSSSYPSAMTSQGDTGRDSTTGKGKGKGKASEVETEVGETMGITGRERDGDGIPEKRYRPPQKPLSPQQLGRIAQSFGIEVPSLPTPPPSGSHSYGHGHGVGTSPGRSTTPNSTLSAPYQPTRSSSCLLTVIPPISLLPPSTSVDSQEGLKRWRRGRLIPLQPTIGSMLLAIAREYGLPSTKGINLYVVHQSPQHQARSSGSSSSDFSDEPGPRISSSTWTSLFASQVASASASRTSTPTGSPHRLGTLLARDNLPHSPLSPFSDMIHIRKDRDRQSSTASSSTLPAPTRPFGRELVMPPTPSSLGSSASASASLSIAQSAVIATIEFDIDQEEAAWFPTFQASGRRRNLSTASEGGVRQLRLLAKTSDDRPRFLQDLDSNTSSESFPTTMTTTSEGDSSFASRSEDNNNDSVDFTEVTILNANGDELLAPFDLRKDLRVTADKRGSGIVMSEELDDLERVMRQLSPKEIRLTSPRVLTPRMAAKVANLQFPPPPVPRVTTRAGPAKSPLVNSFTDTESSPKMENVSHVTPDTSAARSASAWPAVPYAKHSESPGSPQIDEYFKPPTRPSGESSRKSSYSDETIRRMNAEKEEMEESKPLSTEWKPRRPARPPSPNLQAHAPSHRRGISHSLSPELVSALRSPPQQSSPRSPDDEGKKTKSRSNSMSLKGLRASMSGKNVNWRKDDHQRDPMPASTSASTARYGQNSEEPFGLFKQPIESSSSFPGLDTRQSTSTSTTTSKQPILSPNLSEFGSVDLNSPLPDVSSTASLPSKQPPPQSGMRRLFSGSLPFKSRSSTSTSASTESQPPPPQQRSSLKSRRNPSQDGASSFAISSPIPESFHRVENGIMPPPSLSPPRRQPGSPGSPHALKRKPVPGDATYANGNGTANGNGNGNVNGNGQPGLPNSVSFGSVASFVLEDAPKRRTRGQGEYR